MATGERLFQLHCAACHGEKADGTGSIGAALGNDPSNLTLLAQRNANVFPVLDVVSKIDGRTPLPAHGGAMPVYGWFFEGPQTSLTTPRGTTVITTEDIAALVAWLASLQR